MNGGTGSGAGRTVLPYGAWRSPITADRIAAGVRRFSAARIVPGGVVYSATEPELGGAVALFLRPDEPESEPVRITPDDLSVRSRVHEYGGGAWCLTPDGAHAVCVDATTQRLVAVPIPQNPAATPDHATVDHATADHAAVRPIPLTPEPQAGADVRYGDLTLTGGRVLAVEEAHTETGIARAIVDVDLRPLDDPAAAPTAPGRLAAPAHFLASPRISPDGKHLAFIGWEHPHMPWDETTLYCMPLAPAGDAVAIRHTPGASVLQPEWLSSRSLVVADEASGRWELIRIDAPAAYAYAAGVPGSPQPEPVTVLADDGEIGGPLWMLGTRWHIPVSRGSRIIARSQTAVSALVYDDPATADTRRLDTGLDGFTLADADESTALLIGGGRHRIDGLYAYDLASGDLTALALSTDVSDIAAWLPEPELKTFPGGTTGTVHAVVYPPRSPDHEAPAGTLPPYIAFVHGGPTAQALAHIPLDVAYFTSRGIGVIDVNYAGSTGFGREYREALRHQWGIADVADVCAAVSGLVDDGLADGSRLAISGGSAGGWTVLSALTSTDVFACGASYYGVAELEHFVAETHDFESRYIDGLVGPREDAAGLSADRAPLAHIDRLSAPVAILQGEDDAVVPPSQAHRLIEALEARNLPYAARFYPGEAHGFVRPENIADALETEIGFYGRILGFDVPDIRPLTLRGRGR